MKKLMIAAAIVCAAALAQASTVTWGVGPADSILEKSGGDAWADGTAYIVYLGAADAEKLGSYTFFEDGTLTLADGAANAGSAPIVEGYWNNGVSYETKESRNGIYAVILSYEDADGKYYYADYTAALAGATSDPSDPKEVVFAPTANSIVMSTPGEAVPEPTSGLLLLIGVAGLALRRRRA